MKKTTIILCLFGADSSSKKKYYLFSESNIIARIERFGLFHLHRAWTLNLQIRHWVTLLHFDCQRCAQFEWLICFNREVVVARCLKVFFFRKIINSYFWLAKHWLRPDELWWALMSSEQTLLHRSIQLYCPGWTRQFLRPFWCASECSSSGRVYSSDSSSTRHFRLGFPAEFNAADHCHPTAV